PEQLRLRLDGAGDGERIARIDEREVDAEFRKVLCENAPGAAVEVARGDDVIAGAQDRQHAVDGGYAAGEGDAVLRPFQSGEVFLQRVARRMIGARVAVAAVDARLGLAEGRGLIDRER